VEGEPTAEVLKEMGVACEMDKIMEIANKYNLLVIEDAAQGVMSKYKGRALGSIGHLGCYSFHETKNIISGEGGALLINDPRFIERAEIIREKGTDRSKFFRGQVDKYTWVDIGSSYLPSDIIAAFLFAQLEQAEFITNERLKIWNIYHESILQLEQIGKLRRPKVPSDCSHNAHMYYVILNSLQERANLIKKFNDNEIKTAFHYVPLHSSPAGLRYGRAHGDFKNTNELSERLLRLPMWIGLEVTQIDRVVEYLR
jgi:dTDP-4-amino-4,6-dideoxygalactose transaminase